MPFNFLNAMPIIVKPTSLHSTDPNQIYHQAFGSGHEIVTVVERFRYYRILLFHNSILKGLIIRNVRILLSLLSTTLPPILILVKRALRAIAGVVS